MRTARWTGRLAASVVAISFAGAAAIAQEITVEHASGETAVPVQPEKVLVLDINSLDILQALDIRPAGVMGSNLPPYLAEFAGGEYLKVGTLFEPDYEEINAAEADLMIVGGRSRTAYPQLSAMLPTIDLSVDNENYTESVKANVTTLGEIFGREAQAAELVATLDEKLAALTEVAREAGTALVLVTNAGRVGAYGPGSRVGWLHKEAGFATVEENFDDRFHGGDIVSFEYILERNPDWIFVVDRDAGVNQGDSGGAAAATLDNELVAQTDAWREGRVVYLDPTAAYVSSGGYTAITTLIDQVYEAVAAE